MSLFVLCLVELECWLMMVIWLLSVGRWWAKWWMKHKRRKVELWKNVWSEWKKNSICELKKRKLKWMVDWSLKFKRKSVTWWKRLKRWFVLISLHSSLYYLVTLIHKYPTFPKSLHYNLEERPLWFLIDHKWFWLRLSLVASIWCTYLWIWWLSALNLDTLEWRVKHSMEGAMCWVFDWAFVWAWFILMASG